MTIGERLKEARKARGVKVVEIAEHLGLTDRAYRNYENDIRDIGTEKLKDVCGYLKVSAQYVLGLSQNMEIEGSRYTGANYEENRMLQKYRALDEYGKRAVDGVLDIEYERCSAAPEGRKVIMIKYSHLAASAGTGEWLRDEDMEERPFPDCEEARSADIVIPVDGDSMEPLFYDGDEVYVSLQDDIDEGEIGIFIVDNEGYIKKKGADRLISVNAKYDDIYPRTNQYFRCVGRVIGKVERN